jgi:hypothetical protein
MVLLLILVEMLFVSLTVHSLLVRLWCLIRWILLTLLLLLLSYNPSNDPFSRCKTTVGGAVIESISDYNVVNNMIVNTKLNIAQKVGSATALGYDAATALTI